MKIIKQLTKFLIRPIYFVLLLIAVVFAAGVALCEIIEEWIEDA